MDAGPALALIESARSADPLVLVGIGGHGGAGKTTFARLIPGAQIVSTDEFWDGAGFDLARLAREVVQPLSARRAATFASYDWAARASRGSRTVEPVGVVVVEGVCALHRSLRDAYAVRVWVDAPADVRLARVVARDGEAARRTWIETWIPSEERYVARDDPIACAHVVVDGAPTTCAPPRPAAPPAWPPPRARAGTGARPPRRPG